MNSTVNSFVYAIRKHLQKCLMQEVACFALLGPIPMIQPPFNSSSLQYEPGTKFFHHAVEYWCKNYVSVYESCIQSIEIHHDDNTVITLDLFYPTRMRKG